MAPPRVMVLSSGTTSGIRPYGEGGVDQMLVGGHALDVGGTSLGVDLDHPVEGRHVETRAGGPDAGPEQIGRLLGQPHRLPRRDVAVRRLQALHPVPVVGPGGVGIRGRFGGATTVMPRSYLAAGLPAG